MRFQRLDLNLLVALDALLSECSVSQAADRICLSQSATSSALGRLREYFDDELLVLKGRQMMLTPRAKGLIEPVQAVLEQIRSTIAIPPAFDPAASDRVITIGASDYVTEVLLSEAMLEFAEQVPKMKFEISPLTDNFPDLLERGHVDLLLTIETAIASDNPSTGLFEDDFVVVGWSEAPAMQKPITKDDFFELEQVIVKFGKSRIPTHVDKYLALHTQGRLERIVAPSFISVAGFLIGSNRIATMHRKLAQRLARILPLAVQPVPFEIPPIRMMAQWSNSNNSDPAIQWVVDKLSDIATRMDDVQPSQPNFEKLPVHPTADIVRPGVFGQPKQRRASMN